MDDGVVVDVYLHSLPDITDGYDTIETTPCGHSLYIDGLADKGPDDRVTADWS